jgi:hypothetical protein
MSLLLLPFAFAAAPALALGAVLLLLLGPTRLLVREVLVTALPLYRRKLVGMLLLLAFAAARLLSFILSDNSVAGVLQV